MKYVFLDTCIYVGCSLINKKDARPELLVTLIKSLKRSGSALLLPEVVLHEYRRKVDRELERLVRNVDALVARGDALAASNDQERLQEFVDKLKSERQRAARQAREFIEKLPQSVGSVVSLPLTPEVVTAAVVTSLKGGRPSWRARSGDEDAHTERGLIEVDCLIVSGLADWAQRQGLMSEDEILFCSDNHKDFAAFDKEQNRHVIDPEIGALFACQVRFYRSPSEMLEAEFKEKPSPPSVDDLERALGTMRRHRKLGDLREYQMAVRDRRRWTERLLFEESERARSLKARLDSGIPDAEEEEQVLDDFTSSAGQVDTLRRELAKLRREEGRLAVLLQEGSDGPWIQPYLPGEMADPQQSMQDPSDDA